MDHFSSDPWFASEFVPTAKQFGFDYESRDGQVALEFKSGPAGLRDLYASAFQVADHLNRRQDIRFGCLVLVPERLSNSRLSEEWRRVREVIRPEIAARMGLVAVGRGDVLVDPPEPRLLQLGQRLAESFRIGADRGGPLPVQVRRLGALEEVTRVLLIRWLKRQGPIRNRDLAAQVGCSVVTALVVIRALAARKVLERVPNRPVELARFPADLWAELAARERNTPRAWRFVDASGQPARLDRLLSRVAGMGVPGLAVGGVTAARFWCPELDLNGTPRLDLVLHAPAGTADLAFVRRADPALKPAGPDEPGGVLAVHPLRRADPLYEHPPGGGLPVADPVETVLHLEGLRLPAQAKQVLARFRPELRYL